MTTPMIMHNTTLLDPRRQSLYTPPDCYLVFTIVVIAET